MVIFNEFFYLGTTAKCIHCCIILCKSIGIVLRIHILDFCSKTVGQMHFKHGTNVSKVSLYQVCSNGHAPVIFFIFYEFFYSFFGQILKNLLLRNCSPNCFDITHGHFWGPLVVNLFTRRRCDFFLFFDDFLYVLAIFDFFSRTAD